MCTPINNDGATVMLPATDRSRVMDRGFARTDYAGYVLNTAAERIHAETATALAPLGIKPRQLGVLTILAREVPMTQQELGERSHIDRTSMVSVIDDMEQRGWVTRQVHPTDRRAYLLSLTIQGTDLLRQAEHVAAEAQARFLQPLGEGEWEQLHSLLIKLLNQ